MASAKTDLTFRPYHSVDLDDCIRIFHGNAPQFVREEELVAFTRFLGNLDNLNCRFAVAEDARGDVVACAGMMFDMKKRVASLCWGLVDATKSGRGIGRLMLLERLGWLDDYPDIRFVLAGTSRAAEGFFAKNGFETYNVEENYFGDGNHLCSMKLDMRKFRASRPVG